VFEFYFIIDWDDVMVLLPHLFQIALLGHFACKVNFAMIKVNDNDVMKRSVV